MVEGVDVAEAGKAHRGANREGEDCGAPSRACRVCQGSFACPSTAWAFLRRWRQLRSLRVAAGCQHGCDQQRRRARRRCLRRAQQMSRCPDRARSVQREDDREPRRQHSTYRRREDIPSHQPFRVREQQHRRGRRQQRRVEGRDQRGEEHEPEVAIHAAAHGAATARIAIALAGHREDVLDGLRVLAQGRIPEGFPVGFACPSGAPLAMRSPRQNRRGNTGGSPLVRGGGRAQRCVPRQTDVSAAG